jgi:hypothetical protein
MSDTPEPRRHTAESEAIQRHVLTLAAIGRDPRLIPETWEEQASLVDTAVAMGTRLTLVMAMIVARSRDQFADPADWVSAYTHRWGWAKAYLHHMRAVGVLLCRVSPGDTRSLLLSLHWEKLYCISRLPAHLLGPFLEKSRPQDLSRDEVRAAVNRWLSAAGEPAALPDRSDRSDRSDPSARRLQPDFLGALFAPQPALTDLAAWQTAVDARARLSVRTPQQAADVCLRSLAVADAMVDRIRDPNALRVMAQNLRRIADAAEDLAAKPQEAAP